MGRRAASREVVGARERVARQALEPAPHQRLVEDVAAAHHAVDAFRDEIDRAVAAADLEPDVRVARAEVGQGRRQHVDAERGRHIDAQATSRAAVRVHEPGFQFADVVEDVPDACVVGSAVVGQAHPARRPLQQADAEVLLEPRDVLTDARLRQVERERGRGEAAGIDDLDEQLHREKPIHPCIVHAFRTVRSIGGR